MVGEPVPGWLRGLRQRLVAPAEALFGLLAGTRPLPGSCGTFLIACHPHRGDPVQLPDGTCVRHGDPLVEIHIWNAHVASRHAGDPTALTWSFVADFRADLRVLAEAIDAGRCGPRVVAIYGQSPLARGAARFGFFVRPLRAGLRRRWLTAWQGTLRRIFTPGGMPAGARDPTAELWCSRAELHRRYGQTAARG